jgi:hypothetical protein
MKVEMTMRIKNIYVKYYNIASNVRVLMLEMVDGKYSTEQLYIEENLPLEMDKAENGGVGIFNSGRVPCAPTDEIMVRGKEQYGSLKPFVLSLSKH